MHKIRIKLILLMLISLFIISFGLAIINFNYSTRLIKKESDEKLIRLMESYGLKLNDSIRQREYAAADLKTYILNTFDYDKYKNNKEYILEYNDLIDPVVKDMSQRRTSIWFFFNPFILNQGLNIWYYDLDSDGVVELQGNIAYEYYLEDVYSQDKKWYFETTRTRKPYWTDSYQFTMAEGEKTHWVSHSDAVYINDELIGVVGSDFDFLPFRNQIKKLTIYESGYTMLLDNKYNIIVHPEFTDSINLDDYEGGKFSIIKDLLEENVTGITEYKDDEGREFIMAYSTIINDWSLVVVAEKDEIYKSNKSHSFFVSIVIIITFIIILIGSYIISKKISDPIEKLSENINKIGEGDYQLPISSEKINDKSELGVLAHSVEIMRLNLIEALNEINHNKEQLEVEVNERTIDLINANEELNASLQNLKITQARLVQNKKSEAASRMFLELAHKLNTPIGNIITIATYLETSLRKHSFDDMSYKKLEDLSKSMSIIVESATTSADIVNNLKRVTEVKKLTSLNTIELSHFIKEHFDQCIINNKKRFTVNVEVNKTNDIEIFIDSGILKEVLNNLYVFSTGYNLGEIQDIDIRCNIEENDNTVNIMYSDQGHTYINEINEKIFEPFAIKPFSTLGDGLELYLVHNLISTILEGSIGFTVTKEERFCFNIVLPKDIYDTEI